MPKKKYVVPDSIQIAVARKMEEQHESFSIATTCNAFAEVLAEHPIVPTDEQVDSMADAYKEATHATDGVDWIKQGAVEWQKRMFLAPEPKLFDVTFDSGGIHAVVRTDATPSQESAQKIAEYFVRKEGLVARPNGQHFMVASEPEVPEAIKGLLWYDGPMGDFEAHNLCVFEAFHRGQRESAKEGGGR